MEEVGFWEAFWASEAVWIIAAGLIMGTFEQVIDLVIELRDWFNPLFIIDQYDMGVVLRVGKYHRTVGPGLHVRWPCSIEEEMSDTVVRTTSYLEVQSITSKDGKAININAVLVYKIGNIKRWLLEVDDAEEALHDITYGIITELAEENNWDQIMHPSFMEEVTAQVQEEGVSWGARVEAVKLSDRTNSRSMRLWTE